MIKPNYDPQQRGQSIIRQILSDMPKGTINFARGDPREPAEEYWDLFKKYSSEVTPDGYQKTGGTDEIKKSLSNWYKKEFGVKLDKENFLIDVGGASIIIYSGFSTYIRPGATVMMPDSTFLLYKGQIKSINDFIPDDYKINIIYTRSNPDDFEEDFKKKVEKYKPNIFVFATPDNPKGTRFNEKEMKLIADVSEDNDIVVISDEVYDSLIFDGRKHHSILHYSDNAIQVNSASKKFSPNERMGWCCSKNEDRIKEILPKNQILNPSAPLDNMHAYARALDTELINKHIDEVLPIYQRNVNFMNNGLKDLEFGVQKSEAGFYSFSKIPDGCNDMGFSKKLMKNGVASVPGSAFGPGGEGYVRFSLARTNEEEMEKALKIIENTLNS